jgi:hypothetical protein
MSGGVEPPEEFVADDLFEVVGDREVGSERCLMARQRSSSILILVDIRCVAEWAVGARVPAAR